MPAREYILEDYNEGNDNQNLFTYLDSRLMNGGGDCGLIVADVVMAVTVAVTSCDAVESDAAP